MPLYPPPSDPGVRAAIGEPGTGPNSDAVLVDPTATDFTDGGYVYVEYNKMATNTEEVLWISGLDPASLDRSDVGLQSRQTETGDVNPGHSRVFGDTFHADAPSGSRSDFELFTKTYSDGGISGELNLYGRATGSETRTIIGITMPDPSDVIGVAATTLTQASQHPAEPLAVSAFEVLTQTDYAGYNQSSAGIISSDPTTGAQVASTGGYTYGTGEAFWGVFGTVTAEVKLSESPTPPVTPDPDYVSIYAKSDGKLYLKNDTGTEYDLTASGGGSTMTEAEIDFGTFPVYSGVFAITDAGAVTTDKVIASPSYAAATGKTADENEFDSLVLAGYVAANGTVSVVAHAVPGPVVGKFKINYLLG